MQTFTPQLALFALLPILSACGATQAAPTPSRPEVASATPLPPEHHHELHLPSVGPSVHVTLDGKSADIALASVPHEGNAAALGALWKSAFPSDDPSTLHFDLVGSDGFHPASRSKCTRLLTGAEVAAAHIDVVTHDVSFDDTLNLPGCYRVKAVVSFDATR